MANEDLKPSRVGEFTGRYAMQIVTCANVEAAIPTGERRLNSFHPNSGTSADALKKWASQQVAEHLESHEDWKTPPCKPTISRVFEVHQDALDPGGVVWVPL